MESKAALRRVYKKIRDGLIDDAKEHSSSICEKCLSLPEFQRAKTVLLYAAKGSEVDLSAVFQAALLLGKTVGYPRCIDKAHMEFFRVDSNDELEVGCFGILEPKDRAPLCDTEGGDVICFVPGLAFDKEGFRLGYGGGYYDRFLGNFSGVSVGVTYSACLAKELPREEFDRKTDYIITESRVKRTIED